MGSVTHPRGRLPRRVYWVRRSVVLGVALAMVFGIGKLVGGTGEDPGDSGIAATTASSAQQSETGTSGPMGPVAPSRQPRSKGKAPLLPPSGECRDDEVSVLPSVPRAWGGQPIVIRLALQSLQPACTFEVSSKSVVVKITSGEDRIWSSQDCPESVKESEVVVRSGVPTYVNVVWSGRRSESGCPGQADWALPGFYHVFAAAMGSTPTDVQFEVTRGGPNVVTKTPKPRPSPSASESAESRPRAKSSPSGDVSGKQSKCGGDSTASSC